jgi:hypothetical protein
VVTEAFESATEGDQAGYLACFTPRSRAVIEAYWTATSSKRPALATLSAGTVEIGNTLRSLPPGNRGETRVLVRIKEGDKSLGLVLHGVAGTWRIDLLDTERESAMAGLRGAFPHPNVQP